MKASITVLIPAHGMSPYISETLRSVGQNSLLPTEVLVIDDGLTELASQAIKEFRNRLPITVVKNKGSGLVDALNTGLEIASGEFICRIDSDDLMLPKRIERQLKSLEMNKKLVAVGSQCMYINKDGVEIGISNYPVGVLNENPEFQKKCLIAHPSTMYRLESALSVGGYRSLFTWNGTDIAEDFDFWLRLSDIGQIQITEDTLTKYRRHEGQISSTRLHGQILGTPYISAIHIQGKRDRAIKIEFIDNQSPMLNYYFGILKEHLGWRAYFTTRLTFFGVKHQRWFSNGIPKRILLRIINSFS